MLPLVLTTDKIQIITSSTAAIDVVTGFIDRSQTTGDVGLANKQLTAITTATTTDVVAVPGASTTRALTFMSARNKAASASNDVTVQFNASGTLYEMYKVTLRAGETLMYIDQVGFFVVANPSLLDRTVTMTADSVHATAATFADVTGLQVPMLAGVQYSFFACLLHKNDASTTGSQFGVNIGAAPTFLQVSSIDVKTQSITAATLVSGTTTARDTAIVAVTDGSTVERPSYISGTIIPSADGTFSLRCTSEVTVAAGVTIVKGSWLRVWEAA